ncbi:MAG: phage tail tape measure C-terminal domain-containing protein [Pseudomonadota bacterium]
MVEFERQLADAGDALAALANGPGRDAADALGEAFDDTGRRIEQALGRAARSGELDFSRMAEGILRDLARIAAEAVLAQTGALGGQGQTVNFNLALGPGANADSVMRSRGTIATALARTAALGGRFI